jgi:hypothetical protein
MNGQPTCIALKGATHPTVVHVVGWVEGRAVAAGNGTARIVLARCASREGKQDQLT